MKKYLLIILIILVQGGFAQNKNVYGNISANKRFQIKLAKAIISNAVNEQEKIEYRQKLYKMSNYYKSLLKRRLTDDDEVLERWKNNHILNFKLDKKRYEVQLENREIDSFEFKHRMQVLRKVIFDNMLEKDIGSVKSLTRNIIIGIIAFIIFFILSLKFYNKNLKDPKSQKYIDCPKCKNSQSFMLKEKDGRFFRKCGYCDFEKDEE